MYIECPPFPTIIHVGETSVKNTTPTTNTGVIVAVTIVNIIILLLTISLLVIFVTVLIVKKKQPLAVNYTEESKVAVQIYDEVDDSNALKKPTSDTKVYEELDVSKMEDRSQYATMK